MLSEMFSTLKSRHLAADRNPDPFKSVTLNLDGHDSRIIYPNADKASIQNKIHNLDCVAVDGGYSLFIGKLLDSADELQYENFSYPIRKMRGIALTEEEKAYNEIFGSFRSRIEGYFGEMQSTFTKFSHTVVNKVSEKDTFEVQYKLACVLMNIKRFAALRNISTEQHHTLWLQDGFDYPSKTEQETMYALPNIKVKLSQSQDLLATRQAFFDRAQTFDLDMVSGDDENGAEKIIGHRGDDSSREYHVIQGSSGLSMALWVPARDIIDKMRIVEYLKSTQTF
ncbi:hypothetical protein BGZ51_000499 [Haplosporangium sp. Z 767]|nr:hypothetical protein BGZ51_000499 [Haplosporangium sp. Z 767]